MSYEDIPIYTILLIDDNSYISFYHTLLKDKPKPFDFYKTGKVKVYTSEGLVQINIICLENNIQGIIDLKTQLTVHGVILVCNSTEGVHVYRDNFPTLVVCSTIHEVEGIDYYCPLTKQEDTFPVLEELLGKVLNNFELIVYKIDHIVSSIS